MKTTFPTEVTPDQALPDSVVEELMADDLLPEYDIDYSKAKPNRFAGRSAAAKTVKQEVDAATFSADSHATSLP